MKTDRCRELAGRAPRLYFNTRISQAHILSNMLPQAKTEPMVRPWKNRAALYRDRDALGTRILKITYHLLRSLRYVRRAQEREQLRQCGSHRCSLTIVSGLRCKVVSGGLSSRASPGSTRCAYSSATVEIPVPTLCPTQSLTFSCPRETNSG